MKNVPLDRDVRKLACRAVPVCAALLLAACSGGDGSGGESASAGQAIAMDARPGTPGVRDLPDGHRLIVYAVRGEITTLPGGMNDLMAKHEAIPEFVTQEKLADGSPKLGMDVMTMPFPADERYDFGDLEVGDKAMLYFEVEYDADGRLMRHRLVAHEELPADTEMNYTPLPESAGDPDAG